MNKQFTIGILCDMHMCPDKKSPQYAFLQRAVDRMKKDGVETVICLGDITAYGEREAWENYCEAMKNFQHYEVIGNSDVRDPKTREYFHNLAKTVQFSVGTRMVYGVHTPYGAIEAEERAKLEHVKDGDIVFLHYYIDALQEESRKWLTELAGRAAITILHGHKHAVMDYELKQAHVLGMRGLDPDKAIGGYPSIVYMHVTEEAIEWEEIHFPLPKMYWEQMRANFGLSCVDNQKDLTYAMEHQVKCVELRCLGNWVREPGEEALVQKWRTCCDGYLSIHMPNLSWKEGKIEGKEQWLEALEYAVDLQADSLTMHPPRAGILDMEQGSPAWKEFLDLYVLTARRVLPTTRLGIENLHMTKKDHGNGNRGFCYTPQEVSSWIDAINEACGSDRVGHVLDVGHARNNDPIAQQYPISRWYTHMGSKAIAYHVHQVLHVSGEIKNHNPIENWFGPMINYTSFAYAWNTGILAHCPLFLEVKGWENFEKSVEAFSKMTGSKL